METVDKGTKIKTSVSLSPYLYEWMLNQVEQKRFASNSDVMTTALSELKGISGDSKFVVPALEELQNAAIEAINDIKKTAISNEYAMSVLLSLASNHRELLDEINDLIRTHKDTTNSKRSTFE